MKKQIAWIAALVSMSAVLSGCGNMKVTYPNADKYTAGGTELTESVSHICVDWISGEVLIAYHDQDTISFSESGNRTQTESTTMQHWLDGSTLRIQFMKSGRKIENGLEKQLTLYLPEELNDCTFTINSVSADVQMDSIAARSLEFESVSGNLTANLKNHLNELDADTTSGNIDVRLDALDSFEVDSVSGNLTISSTGEVKYGSADTVSGDVTLRLPEDVSFHAEVDTTSGAVQNEFDGKNGKSGIYTAGTGSNEYEIDTVSGDITFEYE